MRGHVTQIGKMKDALKFW